MKKVKLILSFLFVTSACFCQLRPVNKNQDVGKVYFNPDIPASFPGGESAWNNFVASNIDTNIPIKNGAPAGTYTVTVTFIVGMDGALTDVVCKNDPGYGMCVEAVRLIRKSGKWKPATQNGRIVIGLKFQSIVFTIK
jgi:protein TonB